MDGRKTEKRYVSKTGMYNTETPPNRHKKYIQKHMTKCVIAGQHAIPRRAMQPRGLMGDRLNIWWKRRGRGTQRCSFQPAFKRLIRNTSKHYGGGFKPHGMQACPVHATFSENVRVEVAYTQPLDFLPGRSACLLRRYDQAIMM